MNTTVMWLTWRQLFARRRIWFAALFALAPLLFTMAYKVIGDDAPGSSLAFFMTLEREICLGTLLPLAAVIFGTTAFGGEVDDGTLVYLLVKPLPRWQIVASKFAVAVLSTLAVAVPAVLLPWFVLHGADLPGSTVGAFLLASLVAALIYCALFLLLGLTTRRALVVGLLYVIGFEGVMSRTMSGVKSLSVREFAVAIAQAASGGSVRFTDHVVPMSTVYWVGTIMLVGALLWTTRRVMGYELAERV